jgi:hypothetical protein
MSKYVVLRVDGSACRVLAGPDGKWVEHDALDAAKVVARQQAERDGVQVRRYVVASVHAEARATYDERGGLKVAERDLSVG